MSPENHINNYYLLFRLCERLNALASGKNIENCFSLNKQEIFFDIEGIGLKAWFGQESLLFSHQNIYQNNSNMQTCFETIIGKKILMFKAHPQDRSFRIVIDGGYNLVFMMYGRNANILLFKINDPVDQFRKQFEKHKGIHLLDFNVFKEPVFEDFKAIRSENTVAATLKLLFKGFAKDMMAKIEHMIPDGIDYFGEWEIIKEIENELISRPILVFEEIVNDKKKICLNLFNKGDSRLILSSLDPIKAIDTYAKNYYFTQAFAELKESKLSQVQKEIEKCQQQIQASQEHLYHIENDNNYKKIADIIMANLHQIPAGAEKIKLYDFYADTDIEVLIKRGLTPQGQAEKLYRKSKNQVIEKEKTLERIRLLEIEWLKLNEELNRVQAIEDYKELKIIEKADKQKPAAEGSPFRHFNFEGYDIYVGKNAANNDKLTFDFAAKNDMWLHASGVSGSHVIIKQKIKNTFPENVIEKAARLAAFNSRSKGSIMVPVIYTLRKFVRKPKGAPPGSVICENEKMIMVEPGVD